MRVVLDTTVLIDGQVPADLEAAISTVSIAELHFGLLVAPDEETRALRATRLGLIEARFPDPLPIDDRVAREWGRLQAAVASRGANPRTAAPTADRAGCVMSRLSLQLLDRRPAGDATDDPATSSEA